MILTDHGSVRVSGVVFVASLSVPVRPGVRVNIGAFGGRRSDRLSYAFGVSCCWAGWIYIRTDTIHPHPPPRGNPYFHPAREADSRSGIIISGIFGLRDDQEKGCFVGEMRRWHAWATSILLLRVLEQAVTEGAVPSTISNQVLEARMLGLI